MLKILNIIFKKYNRYGLKIQYRHYFGLWLRKMLGCTTFRTDSSNICTTGGIISIGSEYQYREGGMPERAIIEDISFKDFFLNIKVYFPEQDRHVTCMHLMVQCGYAGMWRIWDKGHYDIDEWRREHICPVDQSFLDSLPVLRI